MIRKLLIRLFNISIVLLGVILMRACVRSENVESTCGENQSCAFKSKAQAGRYNGTHGPAAWFGGDRGLPFQDVSDALNSDRMREMVRAKNIAKDEELKKGWTKIFVLIHAVTLKPLHPICKFYVEKVNELFTEEQRKSITAQIIWKLGVPYLALIVVLWIAKVLTKSKYPVMLTSVTCLLLLFVAYDGGYSLTASFWSFMKVVAILIGFYWFATTKFESHSPTPSVPSGSACSSGDDINSSFDGRFTATDTQGREYYGKGDVMYRDTPGDNGTFDRHNDGTWTSRYGDEVLREKGPGD